VVDAVRVSPQAYAVPAEAASHGIFCSWCCWCWCCYLPGGFKNLYFRRTPEIIRKETKGEKNKEGGLWWCLRGLRSLPCGRDQIRNAIEHRCPRHHPWSFSYTHTHRHTATTVHVTGPALLRGAWCFLPTTCNKPQSGEYGRCCVAFPSFRFTHVFVAREGEASSEGGLVVTTGGTGYGASTDGSTEIRPLIWNIYRISKKEVSLVYHIVWDEGEREEERTRANLPESTSENGGWSRYSTHLAFGKFAVRTKPVIGRNRQHTTDQRGGSTWVYNPKAGDQLRGAPPHNGSVRNYSAGSGKRVGACQDFDAAVLLWHASRHASRCERIENGSNSNCPPTSICAAAQRKFDHLLFDAQPNTLCCWLAFKREIQQFLPSRNGWRGDRTRFFARMGFSPRVPPCHRRLDVWSALQQCR